MPGTSAAVVAPLQEHEVCDGYAGLLAAELPCEAVSGHAAASSKRRAAAAGASLVAACAVALWAGGRVAAPMGGAPDDPKALQGKYEAANPVVVAFPPQCPGSISVDGYGEVFAVNNRRDKEGSPSTGVRVSGSGVIAPNLGGRTYFGDTCTEGTYNPSDYASIPLLGKTIEFTVDMSGIGCGCNFAFYLTSMAQNPHATGCEDHYCDANNVCGARCDEVDVMEANSRVWRSTLHVADDNVGGAAGYGGTGPHTQTWTKAEYGPGAACIDTNRPFKVRAHFPVAEGVLQGMMVDLLQDGCDKGLTATVGWYHFRHENAIPKMTQSLADGMVPIVSYWASKDMQWLDGRDINGEDPCPADFPKSCPAEGPQVSDFNITNFTDYLHHSTMNLSPKPTPTSTSTAAAAPAPAENPLWPGATPALSPAPAFPGAAFEPAPLASGWIRIPYGEQDAYYFNPSTGVTSWTMPGR